MTHRREFVQSIAAAGLGAWSGSLSTLRRPRIEAAPTIFHAHPNAEQTLVRFLGFDIDAIAGRMRVYGATGNLLSTAGVLRRGDHLYGEVWLPLRGPTLIRTELEVPDRTNPIRNEHRLDPSPYWTITWVTVADPRDIARRLRALSPWNLSADLALLRRSRVMTNSLAVARAAPVADHVEILRASEAAREVEREFGIPASPAAITEETFLDLQSAPLVLRGNGIEFALARDALRGQAPEIRESPDGSEIVAAALSVGSDPESLGFAADRDTMAAAVETWLTSGPTRLAPELAPDSVLVLSTAVEEDRGVMVERVEEWNGRFAYPRIVVGNFDQLLGGRRPARSGSRLDRPWVLPSPEQLRDAAAHRQEAYQTRLDNIFEPIRRLALSLDPGIRGFVGVAGFPYAGHVAFNSSPFPKSDLVEFPDGRERLVTNTPALGYAYLPQLDRADPEPRREMGSLEITGAKFTIRLDPLTGAIASMAEWDSGREWSEPELGGINHVPDSRVEEVTRVTIPHVGSRLEFSRRTPHGRIHTTITAFDDDPWYDVVNRTESDRYSIDYYFGFAMPVEAVEWEVPAGRAVEPPPIAPAAHLRWIHLRGNGGSMFVRGLDAPYFRVEPVGDRHRLISLTTGGETRYRIDTRRLGALAGESWRFGWDAEPLHVLPVIAGGRVPMPSFSRVVRVDPSTMVLGMKMAEDGFAAIIYLQNPLPFGRDARVEPALLGFDSVTRVDFVERNLSEPRPVDSGGVDVAIPPHGVIALRLSGLNLAGG